MSTWQEPTPNRKPCWTPPPLRGRFVIDHCIVSVSVSAHFTTKRVFFGKCGVALCATKNPKFSQLYIGTLYLLAESFSATPTEPTHNGTQNITKNGSLKGPFTTQNSDVLHRRSVSVVVLLVRSRVTCSRISFHLCISVLLLQTKAKKKTLPKV